MRVLLTGATGQLGQALQASCPPEVDLIALDRRQLDLTDQDACLSIVSDLHPHWVINAAAYTAVDRAESESELAWAVNADAPAALAKAVAQLPTQIVGDGSEKLPSLLQVSTDFVFSGVQGFPYKTDQSVDPLGVYGSSKAEGERRVLELLSHEKRAVVLRTSWVYGPVGRNFCLTMLRLLQDRDQIGVVADQVGCPTCTHGLAAACWKLVTRQTLSPAVMHWCDAGVASWYDFALAIAEIGQAIGLIQNPASIQPLTTTEYPTPAKRPSYSLLDCSSSRHDLGLDAQPWRTALRDVLDQIAKGN